MNSNLNCHLKLPFLISSHLICHLKSPLINNKVNSKRILNGTDSSTHLRVRRYVCVGLSPMFNY